MILHSIHAAGDENLWIGHKNGEITRYDGIAFKPFFRRKDLGKYGLRYSYQIVQGFIWYSTLGEGVFRWDGKTHV